MFPSSGSWQIERDPHNIGRDERWFERGPGATACPAAVPGLIQQVFPAYHGLAWYWTVFTPPPTLRPAERCLLRFAAVDYLADAWVNGVYIGRHEGGEAPFELDVTAALKPGGAGNLLAVRVLNPTDDPIDDIVLNQTPHRNKRVSYSIGWGYNRGGIVGPVELAIVPDVRVTDVFAQPYLRTGAIRLQIAAWNARPEAVRGQIIATVGPAAGGDSSASAVCEATLPSGESALETELTVVQPRLWCTDDPFLYRVAVRLVAPLPSGPRRFSETSEVLLRCGFRELRVEDGYFRLNGRRIFLRCSHTGNDWPTGMNATQVAEALRRDLLYAKTAGFNAIRFIAGMATPAQLDFCDELGLMVYEEAYSSWCLEDSPHMAERFDCSNADMIRRDRNHPSVVIWGLLNETMDGPVFRHAVAALPLIRALDPTRLVLLNTGRMDCELGIGSVSNPGSMTWEHQWGGEAPGAGRYENLKEPHTFGGYPGGYFERVGDAHMYPPTPHTAETIRFLRTLGHDTRPVYLGEYGIASTVNALRVTRLFEQAGARPDLEDAALYHSWAEAYLDDWRRFGMEEIAPFPEDLLRQAQQLHGAQRLLGLNAIRSNPRICGYNLTGTVDQGMTAEGLWSTWREFKPGVLDAVAEGLAPLRWCLFVEPLHAYRGQGFKLDVVLADEDVLAPGEYPVTVRVFGPAGCVQETTLHVWERALTLTVPVERPLAVPLLSEEIRLDGPAGAYVLAANMERGGAPAGGRTTFYLDDPACQPKIAGQVTVWEDDDRLGDWLASRGATVRAFTAAPAPGRETILVGDVSRSGADAAAWQDLARRATRGAFAIFLSPAAFRRGDEPLGWLPLAAKGRCDIFYNSIYHREDVAKRHPIFNGLPAGGIMDWTYYRDVIGDRIFQGQEMPAEVVVASFALGYTCPTGYTSGIVVGIYPFAAGRFLVNTLRLVENLGVHPVADRIVLNMLACASGLTLEPLALLPADFDTRLATIEYQ